MSQHHEPEHVDIARHWCAACGERVTIARSYPHPTRQGGGADRYCRTCGDPSDVSYDVSDADGTGPTLHASTPGEAAALAVARATSHGRPVHIDVLCSTRAAADACGLLEPYDADPDASVTNRIVVRAEGIGRVA